MTTVIRQRSPQHPSDPASPDGASGSTGLGAEFRLARIQRMLELHSHGTDETDSGQAPPEAAPPTAAGTQPPPQVETPRLTGRLLRRWRRGRRRSADHMVTAIPAAAEPDPSFEIPLPNGRLRVIGRTRSWITRLAVIAAPLVLIGGVAYSCGVSAGSARLVQPSSIGAVDAAAFHLTTFPVDRAIAVGVAYLSLCATHPDAADAAATGDRLAALARLASKGVTPGCGWVGSVPSAPPLAVTWDGSIKPLEGVYAEGAAAELGFVVTTADARSVRAALPIWVSSSDETATARVVGDVALVPVNPASPAPTPTAEPVIDSSIEDSLTGSVLMPFLRAWADSDQVQLNLVLATDATASARTGMQGQLTTPVITHTRVEVTRGDPKRYRDGDLLLARVGVDWTTARTGVQRTAYTISLRMTADRWQVTDIDAAAADWAGAASGTAFVRPSPTPAG